MPPGPDETEAKQRVDDEKLAENCPGNARQAPDARRRGEESQELTDGRLPAVNRSLVYAGGLAGLLEPVERVVHFLLCREPLVLALRLLVFQVGSLQRPGFREGERRLGDE